MATASVDLLHVGHIRLLQFARQQGKRLIVAINSDASANRIKGPGRPIVSATERAEMLRALRSVDDVRVFDEDTPKTMLRQLRPHVLVKGPACRGTKIPGANLVQSWQRSRNNFTLVPSPRRGERRVRGHRNAEVIS